MDTAKVLALSAWPVPETRKQVNVSCFAKFSERFIWGYSTLAAPLTALTSAKVDFLWNPFAEQPFEALKTRFTSGGYATVHQSLSKL